MFDTMTVTKVLGTVCASLLVLLFAGWAADGIYSTKSAHHGEEAKQAYVIEVEEEPAAGEEVIEVAFADVFAVADAASGEKVFAKCKACHKLDGTDGTGPHLDGIVNASVGRSEGYNYSAGMASFEGAWTPELLNDFLTKPKDVFSDTKMSFAGLRKIEERANLIAYLATVN